MPNTLLKYLRNGKKQSAAWLWQPEAVLRGIILVDEKGNEKKHLLPEENSVLVHVKEEVDCVKPMKDMPEGYTPNTNVQHALKF